MNFSKSSFLFFIIIYQKHIVGHFGLHIFNKYALNFLSTSVNNASRDQLVILMEMKIMTLAQLFQSSFYFDIFFQNIKLKS